MARRRGFPGPVRRLIRDRLGLAVVAVLALFAVAIGNVTEHANVRVTETVDEQWRGTYDLLVRPEGSRAPLEEEYGVVEPNFLQFTGHGGLGLGDLDQIRGLNGVEIAAPIAVVGYVRWNASSPVVYIGQDAYPQDETLYEVSVEVRTTDGVIDYRLSRSTASVVLPPSENTEPGQRPRWNTAQSSSFREDRASLTFRKLPSFTNPIVAVDPAAEAALLPTTASFLDPIRQVDASERTVGSFDLDLIAMERHRTYFDLRMMRQDDYPGHVDTDTPVLPMAVSEQPYTPLWVDVLVDELGVLPQPLVELGGISQARTAVDAEPTRLGERSNEVTAHVRPFDIASLMGIWPGTGSVNGRIAWDIPPQDYISLLVGPLDYEHAEPRPGTDALSLEVRPQPGDGPRYRRVQEVPFEDLEPFGETRRPEDLPFHLAPVAIYNLADLDLLRDPLRWSPLGSYQPPETHLVAGPEGTALDEPVAMNPTFDIAGLLQPPPLAYTDLQVATLLRGDTPIDAVRVRLAGLERFEPAAIAEVERVATEIGALGFDVDILAGSSPRDVEIHVPEYLPDGGDLGWVRQGWSTLGAAQRVYHGMSTANVRLLALVATIAAVLVVGLQVMRASTRRRESALLATIGWRRPRIVRFFTSQSLLGAAIVAGAATASWAASGGSSLALAAGLLLAVMLLTSSLVGNVAAARRASPAGVLRGDAISGQLPRLVTVGTVSRYAVRATLAHPARTLIATLAIATAATGIALAAAAVSSAATTAGPTHLAEATLTRLLPHQAAMIALAAAVGFVMTFAILRRDATARRHEFQVLRATGWQPGELRRSLRHQRILLAVPAALSAMAATWALATPVLASPPSMPVTIAAATALSSVIWAAPPHLKSTNP